MRAVVQRVAKASVSINKVVHASIGPGLLLLLGIEDDDTLFAILGDRDVIDARTSTRDGQQRAGYFDALQLLTAQEKCVGVGNVTANFIGLTRETIQALDRDLVVGSDLVHGNVTHLGRVTTTRRIRR